MPFLLFYLLRDGHKLPPLVAQAFPEEYRGGLLICVFRQRDHQFICTGTDRGLPVRGRVGLHRASPYWLDYALPCGSCMVTDVIPIWGRCWVHCRPDCGLACVTVDRLAGVGVVIIVQQLESHLVSPWFWEETEHPPCHDNRHSPHCREHGGILDWFWEPIFAVAKVLVTEVVNWFGYAACGY